PRARILSSISRRCDPCASAARRAMPGWLRSLARSLPRHRPRVRCTAMIDRCTAAGVRAATVRGRSRKRPSSTRCPIRPVRMWGMTESSPPQTCDLLIEAGFVVPVEPHAVVLEDHAVAVRDGVIVAVLPTAEARRRFAAREAVSRPDAALIPGLVNAHTHNPMTLLRGIADDLPLKVWLQQHIWPIEGAVMSPAFVEDGVTLAIAELLRGGVTCVNENYFFPDVQAATYRRHGFRARVGLPVIDFPTAWAGSDDEYFDKAGAVHDQWRDDPLVAT